MVQGTAAGHIYSILSKIGLWTLMEIRLLLITISQEITKNRY